MSEHVLSAASTVVEYRLVPEFAMYRIGSDGTVWSRYVRMRRKNGTFYRVLGDEWVSMKIFEMKSHPANPNGKRHLYVNLTVENRWRTRAVHRLVLEAFIGPCPEGMECCHGDGDPHNNTLENLRWDTPASNSKDSVIHGVKPKGERHGCAKMTEATVLELRTLAAQGVRPFALAKKFGISRVTASRIVRRQLWK